MKITCITYFMSYNYMQTNDYRQIIKNTIKNATEYLKYSYDKNQTFTNEIKFQH